MMGAGQEAGKVTKRGLTAKQRRFVEAYKGNGTEAARVAGYAGNDATLAVVAHENLRNPKIAVEVEKRLTKEVESLVASRLERQKFWTEVLKDVGIDMRDRLKASELLGKSEADFTEKLEHSGNMTVSIVIGGIKASEP